MSCLGELSFRALRCSAHMLYADVHDAGTPVRVGRYDQIGRNMLPVEILRVNRVGESLVRIYEMIDTGKNIECVAGKPLMSCMTGNHKAHVTSRLSLGHASKISNILRRQSLFFNAGRFPCATDSHQFFMNACARQILSMHFY